MKRSRVLAVVATTAAALGLSGCGFSPYDLPLPGGADTGNKPFTVTAQFRDVLDLVPQSGVRVNDLPVGKVTDIRLDGWTAKVTLEINDDVKLPDNALATIRQTSLLGEKFVSLAAPTTGGTGRLSNGDSIPLDRTGRNPELEEVFSATSLLFNGGGLERTNTIVREFNNALGGNEPEIKELLNSTEEFLGQLDDNKQALLTSLEKVNRLAIATDNQRDAITGALDDLPGALRVVNSQRDDLVKLLQALNRLGDVATGVVRESKADTVANLKLLVPTLTNLAKASDDFSYDLKALLTYPFSDGSVGGIEALKSCPSQDASPRSSGGPVCGGDYSNLAIRLDLDQTQAEGLLNLLGLPTTGAASQAPVETPDVGIQQLEDALSGVGSLPGLGGGSSSGSGSGSGSSSSGSSKSGDGGMLCGLVGSCRAAPGSSSASTTDFKTALLQPAVQK